MFIFLFGSLLFSCENGDANISAEEQVEQELQVSAINPNGDSELALLMRNMLNNTDSLKQLIVNGEGNISDEFIAEIQRIHVAIPTDPTVKTAQFSAYTDLMISQAEELKNASDNKAEAFNSLVNRCVDCHQEVCPGPIKRIKKLTIH